MARKCAACDYWDVAGLDGALNAGRSLRCVARCVCLTKKQIEGHAKHKSTADNGWLVFAQGCCAGCGQPVDEKTAFSHEAVRRDGSKGTALAHPYPACVSAADAKLATRAFERQFKAARPSPKNEGHEILERRARESLAGKRLPTKGGFTVTSVRDDERQPLRADVAKREAEKRAERMQREIDAREGLSDEHMDAALEALFAKPKRRRR